MSMRHSRKKVFIKDNITGHKNKPACRITRKADMYTTYTALRIVLATELSPDVHIVALIDVDDAQTEQHSEMTSARFGTKN